MPEDEEYDLEPGDEGYRHPAFRKKKVEKEWLRLKVPVDVLREIEQLAGGKDKRTNYVRKVLSRHVQAQQKPESGEAQRAWRALRLARDEVEPELLSYQNVLTIIKDVTGKDDEGAYEIYKSLSDGDYLSRVPQGIQVFDEKVNLGMLMLTGFG